MTQAPTSKEIDITKASQNFAEKINTEIDKIRSDFLTHFQNHGSISKELIIAEKFAIKKDIAGIFSKFLQDQNIYCFVEYNEKEEKFNISANKSSREKILTNGMTSLAEEIEKLSKEGIGSPERAQRLKAYERELEKLGNTDIDILLQLTPENFGIVNLI